MFEPVHACIALGPLAAYLTLIGLVNLSRHPFLTTGGRDTAALGIAVGGFVIAGPMELFMPEAAISWFGPYVWLLLIGLYVMSLTLLVLMQRPRMVIYNLDSQQLRPILANLVPQLDKEARWAGDSLLMPQLGVQLHIEPFGPMRGIQLVSSGPKQSYRGWKYLESALGRELQGVESPMNPYAISLLSFAGAIVILVAFSLFQGRQDVAQALWDMLRL